ncbi:MULTISPECIES: MATE family efflux transporter [Methanobacterium]|uniref:MATE efflux family protein n=1 Tax=Methanobacterium formicicum TaxID=2162 RepID=A0A0S4FLT5_METFO|nr:MULTISPECIES: MATE family efflux transporter [Methanobacterium]KUK74332.1 MAG: MATE efflux family protein [Methanobacterium sp. 42_16]MBF4474251.1 MATE family efflux transporter [Methanobacterium formicicum]MDD4810460.1 MATE family efflux transporter [Methanobacterium formicicum]MDG3546764.1 MATE family efflux transporter [Methanobacterium formicicum]CEL23932.1 MATE efflux family protein [Methanobacterium formicicum]
MNSEIENSKGVDQRISMVTGEPKKAIRVLAIPMIISMFLIMAYNLADSIWVAGLGPNALAALGFINPLFMIVIGLGNGLGAGATSLIARCIGAKNKEGADNAAMHSLILTIVVSAVITVILLLFLKEILLLMGAGVTIDLAMEYGQIVFGGLIFFIFSNVASGILRAEGDVNRPMYAIAATTVLNIILDPIFIYYFGWGVSGAAWATILSSSLSCVVLFYWLLLKRDTYVSFSREDFKASWNVIKNILMVALPASIESLVMSILGVILNLMLVVTGGAEAVAVYTAGWRVVMMAMIPPIGIGTAAITVGGAAYGARNYKNLSTALSYSAKLGVGIAVVTGLLSYVFAGNIATIFTYSPESAFMAPSIAAFLQVMFLFYLTVPLGITASSIFQGMGKGFTSLILTVLREVVFVAFFSYLFAFTLGFGSPGVWWGIVVGGGLGCVVAYIWATIYVRRLKRNY